ncbi:major facilitator superfamily domain-containing protein [Cyathus striatus]|nr:major facilitator superfamily domain-containing protein [Cyathus striatus]
MASERSHLLSTSSTQILGDDLYARFSPRQKSFILAQLSWCGLLPFFVSGTFVPSIPQIAEDIVQTLLQLAVGVSIAATSIGGFCAASYTGIFGRRKIYLATLPFVVIGSIGVTLARNAFQLLFWRFVQSLASCPGRVLGSVIIGDIYKVEERGLAYGIFLAASLFGCAAAPPVDGIIAYYSSWRVTQCLIGAMGLITFIIMILFLPETATMKENTESKYVMSRLFRSLWLLRSPVLFLSAFASATAWLTDYGESSSYKPNLISNFTLALLVPFSYTIAARYNITDEALIGACFIPIGLGNIIGAPIVGYISDKIIMRNRIKRGRWYPEDRLTLAFIGTLIPVPLSIIISGLVTTYVEGRIGLVLNLLCLLMNGIGVAMSVSPAAAYSVDVMHSRSADSVAVTWGLRSVIVSIAISWVIPSVNRFGVAITNISIGIIAWVGAAMYYILLRYGDELRSWVDVGYSEAS